MRVALFAYSSIGAHALETLLKLGEEVVCVCTHDDDSSEKLWFPSVAALARRAALPVVLLPQERRGVWPPDVIAALRAAQPDVLLAASFRRLLPERVLALAPHGGFNLHGSLLPKYRGCAPLNWVLIHGEQRTGMTLHRMVARADAGEIVDQMELSIDRDETAPQLQARLEVAAGDMLRRSWPLIASGRATLRAQDELSATCFGRRRAEDGRFDWSWTALRIHNLVRAVTRPFPGAFFETESGRRYVWSTRPADAEVDLPAQGFGTSPEPGRFLSADDDPRHYFATTGEGILEVLDGDTPVAEAS